tara:strand:+ start:27 stop:581 length:555 start_codon:yes stop_codon:yes gene_type:complete
MKQCSKCKVKKPLDDFHNSKSHVSGKGGYCKVCTKEYNTNRDKSKEHIYKATFDELHPNYMKEYFQNKDNMRKNNASEASKKSKQKYNIKISAGIYAIYNKDELIYIGESGEPLYRSGFHFSKMTNLEHAKTNSNVCYAVSIGELDRVNLTFKMWEFIDDTPTRKAREKCLIQRHRPIYNDLYV